MRRQEESGSGSYSRTIPEALRRHGGLGTDDRHRGAALLTRGNDCIEHELHRVSEVAGKDARQICSGASPVLGQECSDPSLPLALMLDLQEFLGRRVDVGTAAGLKPRYRDHVLSEAVPL